METAVQVEPLRSRAKHPIYELRGVRYYLKPPGYYKYDHVAHGEKPDLEQYLHRAVWIANHGPIPPGHDVHHKDADRTNNHPSNLQCLAEGDHHRLHMLEPERRAASSRAIKIAQRAAAAKRRENPGWASALASENQSKGRAAQQATLETMPTTARVCAGCGSDVQRRASYDHHRRAFCGPRCQSKWQYKTDGAAHAAVCAGCRQNFTTIKGSDVDRCATCLHAAN